MPQPDGPDDQRHLAGVDVPVDARKRLDALFAAAECLVSPRIRTATAVAARTIAPNVVGINGRRSE